MKAVFKSLLAGLASGVHLHSSSQSKLVSWSQLYHSDIDEVTPVIHVQLQPLYHQSHHDLYSPQALQAIFENSLLMTADDDDDLLKPEPEEEFLKLVQAPSPSPSQEPAENKPKTEPKPQEAAKASAQKAAKPSEPTKSEASPAQLQKQSSQKNQSNQTKNSSTHLKVEKPQQATKSKPVEGMKVDLPPSEAAKLTQASASSKQNPLVKKEEAPKKERQLQDDQLPHPDHEDEEGSYVDTPAHPSHNIFHNENNNLAFRTELLNARDVSYLGPVFIGTPTSQGAMVVYDTGSDWLTVKACLTDQHCNKKIDKKKTMQKLGPAAAAAMEDEEEVKKLLKSPKEFEVIEGQPTGEPVSEEDSDNSGDGVFQPFSSREKELESKKQLKPEYMPDVVYTANKSMTGHTATSLGFPLSYGSADLNGFKYSDVVCLNPLAYASLEQVTPQVMKENFCIKDFKYQAVMEAKGLDGCDGILGLSPKDYGSHSILPMLKRNGLISRLLISFSNAFHESSFKSKFHEDHQSYMVFGGYNESQIVGGSNGLFSMPLASKDLNSAKFWGVEGQGFMYGDKWVFDPEKDEPILAVIDSGTTLVILPYVVYEGLMMGIADKVRDDTSISFVCTRDQKSRDLGPCYFNNTRCEDITNKLEPMRFLFGGVVYEIKIQAFLKDVQNEGQLTAPPPPPKEGEAYTGGCMFELRPSKDKDEPPGSQEHRFLMGNTFLKNFVSVYDYDQQQVKLGVSVHSESLAKAYPYKKGMFSKH